MYALASYYNIDMIFYPLQYSQNHSEEGHSYKWLRSFSSCFTFARFISGHVFFSWPLDFLYYQYKCHSHRKLNSEAFFLERVKGRGHWPAAAAESIIKQYHYYDRDVSWITAAIRSIAFFDHWEDFMCPMCCTNRKRNLWTLCSTTV